MNKMNCDLCGVDITYKNWATHLKSQTYLKNNPDQSIKTRRRANTNKMRNCKLSNVLITHTNWAKHLKSQAHLKNDPDQTIPMKRRGRPKTEKPK